MKRRRVAGGLVGVGILIGALIWSWLPRFGGPLAFVGEQGSPTNEANQEKSLPEAPPAEDRADRPAEPERDASPRPANPQVLQVLIDGREYFVQASGSSTGDYRPVSLDELVALALNATGDEDGIRVRITRRGSSRATAEMALRDRLVAAGLTDEAIRWEAGFIP